MVASADIARKPTAGAGLPAAVLIAVYIVVLLIPLFLGLRQELPRRSTAQEISGSLLLIGFMALYLQFILSGRFKWISGKFGIDLVIRVHQIMARVLAILLLVHPFLVVAPWHGVSHAVKRGVVLFLSPSINTGIAAWFLLLVLMLLAIFRDRLHIRYEAWRLSHGIGTAVMAAFATQHAITLGRHSDTMFITLWLILLALSVLTLLYIYILKPLRKRVHPYHVASNTRVGEGLWNLVIAPDNPEQLDFAPGQFFWLNLGRSPFSINEHPFSIASSRTALPEISFLIKGNGDFTSRIGEIPPGTRAYLDGPHGNCTLDGRSGAGIAFITGGVGIAPALSILRQLHADAEPRPIRLVHGVEREGEMVFVDELNEMQKSLDLNAYLVVNEPSPDWPGLRGILNEQMLNQCLRKNGCEDWLYFVWGPDVMMKSVTRALRSWGVPRRQIVAECFTF